MLFLVLFENSKSRAYEFNPPSLQLTLSPPSTPRYTGLEVHYSRERAAAHLPDDKALREEQCLIWPLG